MEGMAENAVDFRPTYDGEDEEPVVLPSNFPEPARQRLDRHRRGHGDLGAAAQCRRALRRGAAPHQRRPEGSRADDLVRFVKGPDFPTGGILVDTAELDRHRPTRPGRGSFRLRARWEKEEKGRGVYQIVVTEIPYGVQKSELVEKIAELLLAKKLPLLKDVRDESADDIRLVLEPRAGTVDAGDPDGAAVPALRPRGALPAQPQRPRPAARCPR